MGKHKYSLMLILLLFMAFFTFTYAFWASSVLVNDDFNTSIIGIGDFQLPDNTARFKMIAAGGFTTGGEATGDGFSVAIDEQGYIWTWGRNSSGQLGNGSYGTASSYDVLTPTKLTTPSISGIKFKYVAAGIDNVVAIDEDGYLWGWGSNTNGSLGVGTTSAQYPSPTKILPTTKFIDVSLGQYFGVAICVDEQLYSWGYPSSFRLGNGISSGSNITVPTLIPNVINKRFKAVDAGNSFAIAIDINGALYGWGLNNYGQVGIGVTGNVETPTALVNQAGTTFSKVAIPLTGFSTALDDEGQIWTWGYNSDPRHFLGDGTSTAYRTSPYKITDKNSVVYVDIAAQTNGGIAIDDNGQLWAWGNNANKTLGPIEGVMAVPTQLYPSASPANFVAVATCTYHVLALDDMGRIWSAGLNLHGQLGNNTTQNSPDYILLDIKRQLD